MKTTRWTTLLLAMALGAGVSSIAQAAGNTAKAALQQATEAAKEWKPDAVLTIISSSAVGEDGKAPTWFYGFYSRRSDSYLNVTAKGRTVETLEVGTGRTEALPAEFIDSDHAMATAIKLGIKGTGPTMGLTRAAWIVNGGTVKGDTGVWINPRTGQLIKRQTME
ncbi:MAG TPA: hypothetical protein VIC04_03665 [Terriglobia bacterium]